MFEEDAAKIVEYYHNRGYPQARVGQPEVKTLENSKDGKTRWIQLRIPVTEGERYKLGDLRFEGNKVVRSEGLRTLYQIEPGEWYSRKKLQDGNKKAQEIYGGAGTWSSPRSRCSPTATIRTARNGRWPRRCRRRSPRSRRRLRPLEASAKRVGADRRCHDAHRRGAAVLRQSDHVHRQHHDARQRDSTRDAAGRRRHLQHRGAQVQRPPSEPARLLQGAEGRRPGHEGRQDARPGEHRRRHAEVRGAEPQPAHLRRRRVAVPRGSSASSGSRPRTSSGVARA